MKKLFAFVLVVSLTACAQTKEKKENPVLTSNGITDPKPLSEPLSTVADYTINSVLPIDAGITTTLKLSEGEDANCVNEKIKWVIEAGSGLELKDDTKCEPTLMTDESNYQEAGRIVARLNREDGKVVEEVILLEGKETPSISFAAIDTGPKWVDIALPENGQDAATSWFNGSTDNEIIIGVRNGDNTTTQVMAWFDQGNNDFNRSFKLQFHDSIQDANDDEEKFSYDFDCSAKADKAESLRDVVFECPFNFELVDQGTKEFKMSFKEDTGSRYSGDVGRFLLKNVFKAGANVENYHIRLKVSHPHSNEVAEAEIGVMQLNINYH